MNSIMWQYNKVPNRHKHQIRYQKHNNMLYMLFIVWTPNTGIINVFSKSILCKARKDGIEGVKHVLEYTD